MNLYHVQINGGWRSVEWCGQCPQTGWEVVRCRYRGEYLKVSHEDLIPVTPRSQWEVQDAK